MMGKTYKVKKVVRGKAEAEAVVCPESFSFLGDVDMDSGEIVAAGNPNKGRSVSGKILIYKETKGSSGGCQVLIAMAKRGSAPAAIVTVNAADYNLTEGAIVAKIPFVCNPDGDVLSEIRTGQKLKIDADAGKLDVLER
jgi:hypothetical protein